ncbi:type II toxin-antitoxin system RelE/ParE family toxin [Fructilactobacillus cliffordii]|uniref:type II toxin-antitoxin system RelE/ParE family toxin n=1 Tax=Fructilactobacillus cliffordii TaxID=2940299 RepID=UPI0020932EB0|nr:type II toxin-antitoxin system RelE/ParE family toxin [Fructilactobacillus cliffordii]USS86313.1 type II toxin-antitoxin system RelE/ParE family toxin [Fructilactobacillus cliffordii]
MNFIYQDPKKFKHFLLELPEKDRVKLLHTISNIEKYGYAVAQKMGWTKKINDNLYEIRSKFSSNIQRGIYFHLENNKYVITHGFTKKTQVTPKKEIKKAKQLRSDYLRHKHAGR